MRRLVAVGSVAVLAASAFGCSSPDYANITANQGFLDIGSDSTNFIQWQDRGALDCRYEGRKQAWPPGARLG